MLVRVKSGRPANLAAAVLREVQAIDPEQPVANVSTMSKNISESLATRRLTMSLLSAFAALALILASVGLYGVMALSVTQRTREFGIRLALGAPREDVFRLALGRGLLLVGIGLGLGLLGALGAGHALTSLPMTLVASILPRSSPRLFLSPPLRSSPAGFRLAAPPGSIQLSRFVMNDASRGLRLRICWTIFASLCVSCSRLQPLA